MSSLIFMTNENSAVIATDTLAVSNETYSPSSYTSKALIIPHLRIVVAGTGVMGFTTRWAAKINDNMVVKDIDHLDFHTPAQLRKLWADYIEEFSIPMHIMTTVYHFGISLEEDIIHSYAYRSINNFESEAISYGWRMKPEGEFPESDSIEEAIKGAMESQRAIQELRPKTERLYIGGEVQIIHLTKKGIMLPMPFCKFDDFDVTEKLIYANFNDTDN